MDKIAQFTVINTYNDLLITKGTLDRNIEDIKAGKRFDHFEEGHDQYVQKVTDALQLVEARLENLKNETFSFFTQDGYLLPSSVKPIYGKDGHYYAVITRECFECGGTGKIANAVCVTCNGSKTSPATEEKLVLKECIEFLETIPELRCNPDLEAWKRRHSEQLALLQADNSKFAASIAQQLNNNLFLTVRQLESFYSTYQPVSEAFSENAGFPIEHSFNIGDVVSFDIIFTEVRAAFSKGSHSYFFTFTGKKQNDGFALTGNVQDHVLLGHSYHLSGKVRKIHYFDSVPYALLTVFKLTA